MRKTKQKTTTATKWLVLMGPCINTFLNGLAMTTFWCPQVVKEVVRLLVLLLNWLHFSLENVSVFLNLVHLGGGEVTLEGD